MDIDPASLSLAQKVALLPEEQRDEIMADMNPDDLLHDWSFWARPNQMPPTGAWGTWLYMAGRGCISGDTEIDLANGGTVRADEAHRTGMPLRLLSLHDDGTIKPTWGTPPYVKGTAEIWMVALDDGRTIAVTDHHRFLTPQGWQPLAALGPGSVIATAANRATEEKTPPSPTLPRYSQQIATGPDPAWLTSLPSVAWIGIERIERRGEEEFYDLTVPGTANYLANFIIHANSGKTRTASEWIHQRVREGKAKRILLLGRTSADVRDVMINGESGIMNTGHPDERPEYFPSKRLLVWPEGRAEATLYSADEPDQLRGPQGDTAWCIAAGVSVATARGLVPVESVAIGDTVMTRAGFKTVTATRSTGVKPVLRIVAEFGEVRCTADHRVWVEGRGWVFAGSIRPGDIVTTWMNEKIGPNPDRRTSSLGEEFVGITTPKTATTEIPAATSFMSRSGNPFTEPAPTVRPGPWTSITSTTTKPTTTPTTCDYGPGTNTSSTITQINPNGPRRNNPWTAAMLPGSAGRPPCANASSAGTNSSAVPGARLFTVPSNAATNGALSIPNSNGSAPSAEKVSGSATRKIRKSIVLSNVTDIAGRMNAFIVGSSSKASTSATGTAPMSAARRARVLFVEPDGSSPTYDLTVDGAHEFFAGGILVHNCDEFASFPGVGGSDGATAFDNLRLAMRLPVPGDMPRMILTTTPRRTKAMFDILDQSERPEFGIVVTKGTTYENLANLADTFRATILGLYEGTRLGQQELMGDMLADIEGALFMPDWFNANRVAELPAGRMYAVVGVDPSVAERPTDECGIVVVKATMEKDFYRRHVYIMEDASVKGSPSVWASRVAAMARKWDAPIVAEGNQGGELVRMAIAQADGNLPVYVVHAKVGKATRAEPVAALAESNRLHIVGSLPELENQAVSWVPAESRYSPDRLDAMVHAVLSVTTRQKGVSFAIGRHLRARSSKSKLPSLNAGSFLRGTGGGRGRRR